MHWRLAQSALAAGLLGRVFTTVLTGQCATLWPPNTPAEIVDRLNNEVNAADPKMKARLADLGGSPADFGKLIAKEIEKWAKVVRAANIKAE